MYRYIVVTAARGIENPSSLNAVCLLLGIVQGESSSIVCVQGLRSAFVKDEVKSVLLNANVPTHQRSLSPDLKFQHSVNERRYLTKSGH